MTFDDGEEGKREGMARGDAAANEEWKRCVDIAIKEEARRRASLTTDHVKKHMEDHFPNAHTHDLRALGARMRTAAMAGILEESNQSSKSTSASRHKGDQRVWNSKIYEGPGPRIKAKKPFDTRNFGWY